jgi:hypothetical protein
MYIELWENKLYEVFAEEALNAKSLLESWRFWIHGFWSY